MPIFTKQNKIKTLRTPLCPSPRPPGYALHRGETTGGERKGVNLGGERGIGDSVSVRGRDSVREGEGNDKGESLNHEFA